MDPDSESEWQLICELKDANSEYLPDEYGGKEELSNCGDSIDFSQAVVIDMSTGKDENPPQDLQQLNRRGEMFSSLFNKTGDIRQLDAAIEIGRMVLTKTPPGNLDRPGYLNQLGSRLRNRFHRCEELDTLGEATSLFEEAVAFAGNDAHRYLYLRNLSVVLSDWFDITSGTCYIDRAIHVAREALQAVSTDGAPRASCMDTLSSCLFSQFETTDDAEHLEEAIQLSFSALELLPNGRSNHGMYLNNLAEKLLSRYERTQSTKDLEEAVRIGYDAIEATPSDHNGYPSYLTNLSNSLDALYKETGSLIHLDKAISVGQQAASFIEDDDPDQARYFANLSRHFHERFTETWRVEDIEEAIQLGQTGLELTPLDHPRRASLLSNLGLYFSSLYEKTGAREDLEKAIQLARDAANVTSHEHPDYYLIYAGNLSAELINRYEMTLAPEDLEEAINLNREALAKTPDDHPRRTRRLENLSFTLGTRFERFGDASDLDSAVSLAEEAVREASDSSQSCSESLECLAHALSTRAQRTQNIRDLERALELEQEGLNLISEERFDRLRCLNRMGNLSMYRSLMTSDNPEDLERSIQIGRGILDHVAPENPARSKFLESLSLGLTSRFRRFGTISDIEEAIELCRAAVDSSFPNHPKKAARLDLLSRLLADLFGITEVMEYLEESISLGLKAVDLAPVGCPGRVGFLNNLGTHYAELYDRRQHLPILEEAIQYETYALDATPCGHPDRVALFHNLSYSYGQKYLKTRTMEDQQKAIQFGRMAMEITPLTHPGRTSCLDNLGERLKDRFERTKEREDLNQCIQLGIETLAATPHNLPNRAMYLTNLGFRLKYCEGEVNSAINEHMNPLNLFTEALESSNAPPLDRIKGGQAAFYCLISQENWERARLVADSVMGLLQTLMLRWIPRDDQQYLLKHLARFSSAACAVVLQTNGTPAEALGVLEQGRGIIASFVMDSQGEIPELGEKEPDLHSSYVTLSKRVHSRFANRRRRLSTESNQLGQIIVSQPAISEGIAQHRRDIEKMEHLESHIRTLQGFEHFLLPLTPDRLTILGEDGPVVTFNVTKQRSDALIITAAEVIGLNLPALRYSDLEEIVRKLVGKERLSRGTPSTQSQRNKELQKILEWLWDVSVKPVLHRLDLLKAHDKTSLLPRIWWVTSGFMGLTPIHAAGNLHQSTADFVVSSYTPTLKALKHSRQRQTKLISLAEAPKMLIVSMPETEGKNNLKTAREVASIKTHFGRFETTIAELPSKSEVLNKIKKHHIVHFACHGSADPINPSESSLLLRSDGHGAGPQRLTVRDLSNLVHDKAQLAYLSACSTAENTAEDLIDEVIHIASAFQLIGFPGVIGTLWEANDKASVIVSGDFYKRLAIALDNSSKDINRGLTAYAFHQAVISLRLTSCRKTSGDPLFWAPFIHIGA
ncbi:hypothetical protein AJ79_05590 [Helicocarpus griseus UAMH5409]|uniref:CHAT domain-containing protein n=1 Tax=Helicocarpus griseus UAMH5409 TaxID=1447875 RepID=A0A2B7XDX8_9EURO|nr:hypothetical protein AJ79_05590 [Helicocarpus griseus UAMH5409]